MINRSFVRRLPGVVAMAVLLGGCGFGVSTGETRTESITLDLDDSKIVRVRLRMGSGQLTVNAGTAKLAEGKFAYNVAEWKPVVDYRPGELSISQPNSSGSFGNTVNNWDVTLNREVPLDISAHLGAGEATLALGEMNLNEVEMNIGAGEVKMDLRGEPKRSYTVRIRGGVGATVVHLPKDVAISATATKGIGDIRVEGLEQHEGVWVNPDRIGAPVTVRLDVKGGIGEIRLALDR